MIIPDQLGFACTCSCADQVELQDDNTPKPSIPQVINKSMEANGEIAYGRVWRRFIPAIVMYPMWLYVMTKRDMYAAAFSNYYPLTLAMIAGSIIAGSTPLGGGVVAFPVSVIVVKFKPEQGRDFALIIQSVGMTAASFLIVYAKRQLCQTWLILWFSIGSILGLLLGLEIVMSPFIVNVTFTTAVLCFAIAFGYRNLVVQRYRSKREPVKSRFGMADDAWALLDSSRFDLSENFMYKIFGRSMPIIFTTMACCFGVVGGLLTSKLGSGADMMAYIFGAFVWNGLVPEGAALSDNMLTASSVLIMAGNSIGGTLMREMSEDGISTEVKLCWAACIPIVVLGAPMGSLLLTPRLSEMLRRCFYVLSLIQFATFGSLKIRSDVSAWIGVAVAITTVTLLLLLHFIFVLRARDGF